MANPRPASLWTLQHITGAIELFKDAGLFIQWNAGTGVANFKDELAILGADADADRSIFWECT